MLSAQRPCQELARLYPRGTSDFGEFQYLDSSLSGLDFPDERIRSFQPRSKLALCKASGIPRIDDCRD
jgi:hypothetical protein